MTTEAEAAANALGGAIHARSKDQILAIYADDMFVWHGNTARAMGKEENATLLGNLFAITSELEYTNIKRYPIDGGVVQQHRLVGKFTDGNPIPSLEACLVIKVRDGLITSIEEYFDGSVFAEVWERLAEAATA